MIVCGTNTAVPIISTVSSELELRSFCIHPNSYKSIKCYTFRIGLIPILRWIGVDDKLYNRNSVFLAEISSASKFWYWTKRQNVKRKTYPTQTRWYVWSIEDGSRYTRSFSSLLHTWHMDKNHRDRRKQWNEHSEGKSKNNNVANLTVGWNGSALFHFVRLMKIYLKNGTTMSKKYSTFYFIEWQTRNNEKRAYH